MNPADVTEVLDRVAQIARSSGRMPGDCVACANQILAVFHNAHIEVKKVELQSNWQYIVHKDAHNPIAFNGRHFAVESSYKIYDAFHPEGIARDEYLSQFRVPPFATLELIDVGK